MAALRIISQQAARDGASAKRLRYANCNHAVPSEESTPTPRSSQISYFPREEALKEEKKNQVDCVERKPSRWKVLDP